MKQLLVKLPDDEYQLLNEYCKQTGRTKSAVVRYYISKLNQDETLDFLHRKVNRISPGQGKLLSELIMEMRS